MKKTLLVASVFMISISLFSTQSFAAKKQNPFAVAASKTKSKSSLPPICQEWQSVQTEAQEGIKALQACRAKGGNCDKITAILTKLKQEDERLGAACKAAQPKST